jgi:hypothetical protein
VAYCSIFQHQGPPSKYQTSRLSHW